MYKKVAGRKEKILITPRGFFIFTFEKGGVE